MGVQEELFPGFVILPSGSPNKLSNRGMFPKRRMQLARNDSPSYGHRPQAESACDLNWQAKIARGELLGIRLARNS